MDNENIENGSCVGRHSFEVMQQDSGKETECNEDQVIHIRSLYTGESSADNRYTPRPAEITFRINFIHNIFEVTYLKKYDIS